MASCFYTVGVDIFFAGFCMTFLTFSTHGERRGSIQLLSPLYSIKIQRIHLLFIGLELRIQLLPSILSNNLLKISSSYIFQWSQVQYEVFQKVNETIHWKCQSEARVQFYLFFWSSFRIHMISMWQTVKRSGTKVPEINFTLTWFPLDWICCSILVTHSG